MAGILRYLVLVAAAGTLGQIPTSDVELRPLEWLRSNCVPIRDPYVDGPDVTRTCRVNEVKLLGTIDGTDVYYGLYRRLVSFKGSQLLDQSTLDEYDRSPYSNTAVAVMEGPTGAGRARVVHAFANQGDLGERWYEAPELIHAPIGDIVFLPCVISGTGGMRDDHFFLRQGGQWAPIDTAWSRDVLAGLPRGHWLRNGFTDIRSMRGALVIAKPDDFNCCPTGGWMVVTLELNDLALVIKTLRHQPDAPSWVSGIR